MSSQELTEWMSFSQLEPFGFRAMWQPFAVLLALLANVHRNPKKGKKFKPEDFMPKEIAPERDEQDWQTMLRQAQTITQLFGGKIKKDS